MSQTDFGVDPAMLQHLSILADPFSLLPDQCLDYLDPSKYTELGDISRFDGNYGAALLFGGDDCQIWLTLSV